ncbi:MAG: hypothetical protein HYW25_04380 [Candidatus Aenigmarchaeota archaeon]|nr:hypothetical protein [Candidatus Aenigmarchaeota archaeon]
MVLDLGVNSAVWNIISLALTLPAILWLYKISSVIDRRHAEGWRTFLYAIVIFAIIQIVLVLETIGLISAGYSAALRIPLRILFPAVLLVGVWQQKKLFMGLLDHKVQHRRKR